VSGAVGEWSGTNKLWFTPTDPAIESATAARVETAANGKFLTVRYTWAFDGKPQEGFLLLGDDPKAGVCDAILVDSFHNSDRVMPLTGPAAGDGEVSVLGSYPAPPGPDWGWRVTLELPAEDRFVLRMFNITPDGTEALAVEASYARRR
jgi:hypothetical protein